MIWRPYQIATAFGGVLCAMAYVRTEYLAMMAAQRVGAWQRVKFGDCRTHPVKRVTKAAHSNQFATQTLHVASEPLSWRCGPLLPFLLLYEDGKGWGSLRLGCAQQRA